MSSWLVLGINVILLAAVVVALRGYIIRQTTQRAALDDIKHEVGAIITEINQTTERNIELIEDRISRLNELIESADKRVGVLRRHEASDKQADATYSRLKPTLIARPSAPVADGDTGPSPETPTATGDTRVEPEIPLRDRVRTLYLRGLSLERISSLTGRTVGEIELMIALDEA